MIGVGLIQLLILIFALLRAKGLAVMLGPEGVGVIGTVDQLVVTLTQISAMGIPFTAMKFMSAAHSVSEEAFRNSFAAFGRLMLALSLVVLTISLAVILLTPHLLSGFADYGDVVLVALFSVPPTMMTILVAHSLASEQRPVTAAVYNLAFSGGIALAGLVGAYLGGVRGFYVGAAGISSLTVIAVMTWLARSRGLTVWRRGISLRRELAARPNVIRTALAAYFALVAFSATMLIIRYAVIRSLGEAETGILQAALSLALSVGSILATMNGLYLAPSLNRNEPEAVKFRKAARFCNRIALLMVAGAVPVALLPGFVLSVLFTGAFVPAALTLILCLIWQALFQLATAYAQLLIGIDRPLSSAAALALSVVVSTAVVFGLVGQWGILAAAVALVLGTAVAAVVMIGILVLRAGMPLPWAVLGRFVWVMAAIGGAGLLFDTTVIWPDLQGLALRAGYALIALGVTWMTMPADLTLGATLTRMRGLLAARPAPR